MPDLTFLLVGVQKAGTTWLAKMVSQHPDVHTAVWKKEVSFFGDPERYPKGIDWYREQFRGYAGETAIGEFTPHYLWTNSSPSMLRGKPKVPEAHEAIYEHYPDIKFIVSLRNPVERAVSAYLHHIRKRRISPSSSLLEVGHKHGIISLGRYYTHLSAWLELFSRDQFLVLVYEEDIQRNKRRTLRKVFRFLGVDDSFVPRNIEHKYNRRTGHLYMYMRYYWPLMAYLMRGLPGLLQIDYPRIQVDERERDELAAIYAEEVDGLEKLLGRTFPWSIKPVAVHSQTECAVHV